MELSDENLKKLQELKDSIAMSEASDASVVAPLLNTLNNTPKQDASVNNAINTLLKQQDDSFQKAQEQSNTLNLIGMLGKAGAETGAAIAGVTPRTEGYEEIIRQANKPLKHLEMKQEFDRSGLNNLLAQAKTQKALDYQDKNSAESKSFRKSLEMFPELKKVYGEYFNDITASDKELIFEPLKLKETIEARKLQQSELKNKKQDVLDLRERELERKIETTTNARYDRETRQIRDSLEATKRIDGFVEEIKSGALVPSGNVVAQLTNDIAQVLAGRGITALADREKLAINTLQTTLAKVKQFATDKPQDAIPPEFLKQIEQETNILKKKYFNAFERRANELEAGVKEPLAKNTIRNRYNEFLNSYKDNLSDEREVERVTKDGKTAIFDANTKKFLRYKGE